VDQQTSTQCHKRCVEGKRRNLPEAVRGRRASVRARVNISMSQTWTRKPQARIAPISTCPMEIKALNCVLRTRAFVPCLSDRTDRNPNMKVDHSLKPKKAAKLIYMMNFGFCFHLHDICLRDMFPPMRKCQQEHGMYIGWVRVAVVASQPLPQNVTRRHVTCI
jgi:hypothetical protein